MSDRRKTRLTRLTIGRLAPNMVTLLAMAAGLTAVRFALAERWEMAVLAVVVAIVFDGLDGRVARLMDAASEFGAQLDSLADVINFGVVPALLVSLWAFDQTSNAAFATVLVFVMCTALRLARFNVGLSDAEPPPPWSKSFFTGVPAPAGGGLVLLPMILSFELQWAWLSNPLFNALVLVGVGLLMVSRLPTFSFKRLRLPRRQVGLALLLVGGFVALLVSAPWITLSFTGLIYLATLPVAYAAYRKAVRIPGLPADETEGEKN